MRYDLIYKDPFILMGLYMLNLLSEMLELIYKGFFTKL
ncbi:phospho-N-acetylmuramoyl-pentapeptide-transferase [Clostridium botulinum]|uniref:Phospho-N-acetylmuramoyl-pentapeptide-transferase n=1 Tax=Clostridium botulinum TaxID=1491 RepID=A0A846I1R2_CLOBO|nr:phospho-N-acetylmuramoyl-pentapeptide-transferase [Clostridium botulinum]EDT87122.1 phospho-N-acetylmuramoyl-pentapeptide-transferase [Clostridium botulinum Bf]AXG93387.1 phospho-N-acetylmuramoyl-pentapeptide-transferase [Clostridium botulinum]MBN3396198.1 phospho-N-acetylmuramoyl-pentapeptide-transferase [Clostridium botulinum]MBN3411627.1 phospho-N-acetylmuramoyl-pentapeptide-transferase [Clostridium botulinum]